MAKLIVCVLLASLSLAYAQDSLAYDCKVRSIKNKKWYGNKISSAYVETDAECAAACWVARGKGCKSVNYQETTQRCELMSDTYMNPASDSGFIADFPSITYMEVVSCIPADDTNPEPEPEPEPEPGRPTPKPKPTHNATTTIKAGSCGLSSVPNKVSRNMLARRSPMHRIVGGVEAKAHSMPWIVSLRSPRSNFHFCGGTLVRVNDKDESDIVITAAHCLEDGNLNVDVVAGAHYISEEADGEQRSRIDRVVLHPEYNYPVSSNNDIAIIKLEEPIQFSDTVQPACLPALKEQVPDGTNGIVAGWGVIRENGQSPDALRQVVVPSISSKKCVSAFGRGQIVPDAMLCAGYDEGMKDACQGDSGGPLIFPGANGGYVLQGVVSWGSGCARPRAPGIYARVSTYIDWIQRQVSRLSSVH